MAVAAVFVSTIVDWDLRQEFLVDYEGRQTSAMLVPVDAVRGLPHLSLNEKPETSRPKISE